MRVPGTTIRAHDRTRQVLRALYRHGPMSRQVLNDVIDPPMKSDGIGLILGRLKAKGWIVERTGDYRTFQINQRGHYRKDIAETIGVPEESLKQSWARFIVQPYEDFAVLWADRLWSAIPGSTILRRHEIAADPTMKHFHFADQRGQQVGPDLLVKVSSENTQSTISVRVRIDRDGHSSKRNMETLRGEATHPMVDGVLYLVTREVRDFRLTCVNESKYLRSKLRQREVGEFFLMFGDVEDHQPQADPLLHSSNGKQLRLTAWIHLLQKLKAAS